MTDNKIKIKIQFASTDETTEQTNSSPTTEAQSEKPPFDWRKIGLFIILTGGIFAFISHAVVNWQEGDIHPLVEADSEIIPKKIDLPSADILVVEKLSQVEIDEGSVLSTSVEKIETNSISVESAELSKEVGLIPELKPDEISLIDVPEEVVSEPSDLLANTTIDDAVHIISVQLTSAIERREPIDSIETIWLDQGNSKRIYLFMQLRDLTNQKVSVDWYYQGQLIVNVPLHVGGKIWRTNASKLLSRSRLGAWYVVVVDQSGKQLIRRDFSVNNRP